jgi:thiamine-phosphate pyrophosphorylase
MPKSSEPFGRVPALCMVTDGAGAAPAALVASIGAAARAGVDIIQIRESHLDDRRLFDLSRAALRALSGTGARLVVNDRLDVAKAAGADGVHLRADSFGAARAKSLAPSGFLVGRSVHSEQEAMDVEAAGGCDYLLFGTVYASDSKPAGHVAAGLDALRLVCERVQLPVLAIGGITVDRAAAVARAGAAGIAGISVFSRAADIAAVVTGLRSSFDT